MQGEKMNLAEETKPYTIISFDIFDTLLLRTVAKPIDVFAFVWKKAENIKLTDLSDNEFIKMRVEMECRAKNHKTLGEVTLDDIYKEFPDYIVTDLNKLRLLEIETEKQICYRNDSIYHCILECKKAGKNVCLLSDMYLDRKAIIEILGANKIDTSLFDAILLSNEENCSKQTGELFNRLIEKFPMIKSKEILHIGDNKNADFIQAKKKGIAAFHYNAVPEKLNSIYDYERIRHNIPHPEILSLRKTNVYEKIDNFDTEIKKNAYEIGSSIIGPFLTLFISHVCDRLETLKITRIYPFMREGYLLGELLKKEANNRKMPLEIHPIYVSRKVTYIPSIRQINREEIENIIGTRNLTLKESIDLLGLKSSYFEEVKEYGNLPWKETHKIRKGTSTLKEYLINKFLEPKHVKEMEHYIKEQREYLIKYLNQEIKDFNHAATIDIGFFGRIQLWIEQSLTLEHIPHKMKHFLAVGITGEKVFDGINFEGYYGTYAENTDLFSVIHRTTDILEKFISVTEGSTIGYKEKNGYIVPIKAGTVANDEITKASFQGIFDFQKAFHIFAEKKIDVVSKIKENRRSTLMILHRLIDMPRRVEVELVQKMEADTNFGTNYKNTIITEENIKLLQEKGPDFIDKCNISYTYQNSKLVWPKGVVTLEDEYYYVRRVLKNNANSDIIKAMLEVIEKVKEDGVKKVALYGAGENGRQFYFLCMLYHLKVNCFIDRKKSIWGTKKEGIDVIGLEEAMAKGNDAYIVTSLFSISEITDFIKEKYKQAGKKPQIYSV